MTGARYSPAECSDAALVAAITRAAFASTARYAHPSSALWEDVDGIRADMGFGDIGVAPREAEAMASLTNVWIARDADMRPIAACRTRSETGDGMGHLYFSRLAVLPALQGRGVGSAFVDHIERLAAVSGFSEVRCSARSSMPDNRTFYLRRGYDVVGYEDVYGVPGLRTNLRKALP